MPGVTHNGMKTVEIPHPGSELSIMENQTSRRIDVGEKGHQISIFDIRGSKQMLIPHRINYHIVQRAIWISMLIILDVLDKH